MRAYLTPLWQTDDTLRRIDIPREHSVGVYRSGDGYDLYADKLDGTQELGIRDPTVSSKKGGSPPVKFQLVGDGVEIRNHSEATNAITVLAGREGVKIPPGDRMRVTDSGKVEIGFNASVRLTIESRKTLGPDEIEELIESVQPPKNGRSDRPTHAAYARSVATNLRKASSEAPNECLKFATDLHNFLKENPVDADEYEHVTTELDRLVHKLETKVSADALDGSSLDDEQQDRIDRIAHRVTTIYAEST